MRLTDVKHGHRLRPRFLSKVRVEGEHWMWVGGKYGRGYGTLSVNGKSMPAHRVSFMLEHGEVPDDLYVLHSCDIPACVRPDHLRVGTARENGADASACGRARTTVTLHGQQRPNAKLSSRMVQAMRRLHHEEGIGSHRLARLFAVAQSTALRALRGDTHRNVSTSSQR